MSRKHNCQFFYVNQGVRDARQQWLMLLPGVSYLPGDGFLQQASEFSMYTFSFLEIYYWIQISRILVTMHDHCSPRMQAGFNKTTYMVECCLFFHILFCSKHNCNCNCNCSASINAAKAVASCICRCLFYCYLYLQQQCVCLLPTSFEKEICDKKSSFQQQAHCKSCRQAVLVQGSQRITFAAMIVLHVTVTANKNYKLNGSYFLGGYAFAVT